MSGRTCENKKCPGCGEDRVVVMAFSPVYLIEGEVVDPGCDPVWHRNCEAKCLACGWKGVLGDFRTSKPEIGEFE